MNHLSAIKTERESQQAQQRARDSKSNKTIYILSKTKMGIVAFQWGEGENTLTLLQNRENWQLRQV